MSNSIQGPSNPNLYLIQTPQDGIAANGEAQAGDQAGETLSASASTVADSSDFSGSLEARVAAMVLQHATNNRKLASEQRNITEKQISRFEEREVSQMHRSADVYREQAKVDFWMSASSAGAKAAGQFANGKAGAASKAGGQMIDATQTYVDGEYKGLQEDIKVHVTEAEHAADAAKRSLESINDAKKGADNLEDRALNFFTTAAQTRADAERALIFRG